MSKHNIKATGVSVGLFDQDVFLEIKKDVFNGDTLHYYEAIKAASQYGDAPLLQIVLNQIRCPVLDLEGLAFEHMVEIIEWALRAKSPRCIVDLLDNSIASKKYDSFIKSDVFVQTVFAALHDNNLESVQVLLDPKYKFDIHIKNPGLPEISLIHSAICRKAENVSIFLLKTYPVLRDIKFKIDGAIEVNSRYCAYAAQCEKVDKYLDKTHHVSYHHTHKLKKGSYKIDSSMRRDFFSEDSAPRAKDNHHYHKYKMILSYDNVLNAQKLILPSIKIYKAKLEGGHTDWLDAEDNLPFCIGLYQIYYLHNEEIYQMISQYIDRVPLPKSTTLLKKQAVIKFLKYQKLYNTKQHQDAIKSLDEAIELCEQNNFTTIQGSEKLVNIIYQAGALYYLHVGNQYKYDLYLSRQTADDFYANESLFKDNKDGWKVVCFVRDIYHLSFNTCHTIARYLTEADRNPRKLLEILLSNRKSIDFSEYASEMEFFIKISAYKIASEYIIFCVDKWQNFVRNRDVMVSYNEFIVFQESGLLERAEDKLNYIREFYDPSGKYASVITCNAIEKANKVYFLYNLSLYHADNTQAIYLTKATECLEYMDLASREEMLLLLPKLQSTFKDVEDDHATTTLLVADLVVREEIANESTTPATTTRVRDRPSLKSSNIQEIEKKLLSGLSLTHFEWHKWIQHKKTQTIHEDQESWIIDGKIFDLAIGVTKVDVEGSSMNNLYTFIEPKIFSKLRDDRLVDKFTDASVEVASRNYGSKGIKFLDGRVFEVKILGKGGEIRVCSNTMYTNTAGRKLIIFDTIYNHADISAFVARSKLIEITDIDIKRDHIEINSIINQFTSVLNDNTASINHSTDDAVRDLSGVDFDDLSSDI